MIPLSIETLRNSTKWARLKYNLTDTITIGDVMIPLGWVAIPKNGNRPIGHKGKMTIYNSREKAIWSAAQGFVWTGHSYEKRKAQALNNFNFKEVYVDGN